MNDDLAYLSATEAIARFRRGDLSPVELMEAVIARAEATEPVVNAFTDTHFDEAREQAAQAADAYSKGEARPLEGLPVAVKEEVRIAGRRWTQGSLIHRDDIADETDVIAQRILDAGGIVHARTATPEFSMAAVTWTLLEGITRNPWNPDITCGGSSGGSGASLAAGSSTLASGSDIGGSIRIPASLNGVVGFKPPWGRVPELWPWNREPYAASGPMARTVADVILMQNVVSGPLTGDMFSLPPLEIPDSYPPIEGMRIALSPDLGYFEPDPATLAALEDTAATLGELEATVEPVDLGWDPRAGDTALTHFGFQARRLLQATVPQARYDELTSYIREWLEQEPVTVQEWVDSWQYGDEMYRMLQEKVFLAGYDVLVCPTLTTTVIDADLGHPDAETELSFDGVTDLIMTYPFNVLGKLPLLNVPAGFDPATGVPIGAQIVGPVDRDPVPFRVGAALEEARGNLFAVRRPTIQGA
jgi:Asp-tRNA(Asn)/Glu-tRNA(Gln) amidotransferase A subunit family amidase